jgi:hypothetical protein
MNVNSCQPLFAMFHNRAQQKKTFKPLYIIYILGFYIMFEGIFV